MSSSSEFVGREALEATHPRSLLWCPHTGWLLGPGRLCRVAFFFFLERKEPVQFMWSEIVPVYLFVSAFGRAFIHTHRSPVSLSQADFCLRIKSCTRKPLKLFLFASILIGA